MAGENPIDVSQYPDQFFYITFHAAIAEDLADGYFFYCERDIVIDEVFAVVDTADDNTTVDITKGAGGTSIFSTVITTGTVDTISTGTVSPTENYCPAGTILHLNVTNVDTATGALVQARARTRLK
jgi:hypothetical protein